MPRRDYEGRFTTGRERSGRGDGRGDPRDIERNRDPYGRFVDDEYRDQRSFGSNGPSWYEEDYRGSGGGGRGGSQGQGRGGFRDSERHAEAGRQRWEDENLHYGRSDRFEDHERSGRGGNRGGPDRDEHGRFMSDDEDRGGRGGNRGGGERGHREGHRGGDHRGWFGDSRGHAQAARLGWRHRQ